MCKKEREAAVVRLLGLWSLKHEGPAFIEHKAQPGAGQLGRDERREDQGGVETRIDEITLQCDRGQDDAWASSGIGRDGQVD